MELEYAILLITVGIGFSLSGILYITSGSRLKEMNPNLGTRTFLVLLRLAIGWHMMVEGMDKLYDPTWTSEGYLRVATGPFAGKFRELAGTPVFDRLTLNQEEIAKAAPDFSKILGSTIGLSAPGSGLGPMNSVPTLYPGRMPAPLPSALQKDWQRYFDAFISYYGLTEDQKKQANEELKIAKANTFIWIATDNAPVNKAMPAFPSSKLMTIPQRMDYYWETIANLERIEKEELPKYGSEVHDKLNKTKGNAIKTYKQLEKGLEVQTEAMKQSLWELLTTEQKSKPVLTQPLPPVWEMTHLQLSDQVVRYGLVFAGAFLLIGFLSRPSALFGAVLLFLFYLAMPPLPDWPANPRAEGHYLYINKNLIEMLALLTLATTMSGRWLGIDGLIAYFLPWNRPKQPRPVPPHPAKIPVPSR